MAESSVKYLKPIKDICQKIPLNKDINQLIADLKKCSDKGAFYEYHVFVELLEVLSQNPDFSKSKVKEIFKLLSDLLHNDSNSKESILSRLYNFILIHKDRLDLIENLILTCSFSKRSPRSTKPEHLFYISEILLRFSQTSSQRHSIHRNFLQHFTENWRDDGVFLKVLQSANRSVYNLMLHKKDDETAEFLEETFVMAIKTNIVRALSKEVFEELFNIISVLAKQGQNNLKLLETGKHITENLSSFLTGDQKNCNDIMLKIFDICKASVISQESLKDLLTQHYSCIKEAKSQSLIYQNTTQLVAKLLAIKIRSFELTTECFFTYHKLVVGMFHVIKSIKNNSEVKSCCQDIKRHEIHNLSISVLHLAAKLAKAKTINRTTMDSILYHVTYNQTICSSLKCQSKDSVKLILYESIYAVLYEFAVEKEIVPENISKLHECIKEMFKVWDDLPDGMKNKIFVPDNVARKIYEELTFENSAVHSSNGLLMLMSREKLEEFVQSSRETKKTVLKTMFTVRKATTLAGFSSTTEFIRSKKFSSNNQQIAIAQTILIEICTIFRYDSGVNTEVVAELFSDLCNKTTDPSILALACQNISDEVLKKISVENFNKVNKLLDLEASKRFDLDISLALALNNYNIFFVKSEATKDKLRVDTKSIVTNDHLQSELAVLEHLNVSLEHFTDLVCYLHKSKIYMDEILSMKRILNVLNNMANQYYIRGIKFKDIETFTLLWNVILLENNSKIVLLNIGTFFLDHCQILVDSSGNYVKISKKFKQLKIEEILETSNKIIDELFMTSFKEQPLVTQCSVWSYLLSLCVYYMAKGRKIDGYKRWDQFVKSWESVDTIDESDNRAVVRSKIYFCMAQINMNCRYKSADKFLSIANGIMTRANKIGSEFVYHFHQIYQRITINAINYSINRLSDMNHYNYVMLALTSIARKKGYFLMFLDLLSLSIQRNLDMEKIDNAKSQLKEITNLLGLQEEILIESPIKEESVTALLDYEFKEERVRKCAVPLESPLQCELSVLHEDQSEELFNQLKSFIHKSSCKCNVCKIPQLKFIMFQIGCHYSRLLWLMNKLDVSMRFNQHALETWRNVSDKLRRINNCEFLAISRVNFAVFSIRWLFHCADTLIKMKKFEDVQEIYQEVDIIGSSNIPDYRCFKEALYSRKENLMFLVEHGLLEEHVSPKQLNFEQFMKIKKSENSPTDFMISKRPVPKFYSKNQKTDDIIYVDGSDDEPLPLKKLPSKVTKKITSTKNNTEQASKSSSKSLSKHEPATKPSTRRGKVVETDLTTDIAASTRKTRRMI